MTQEHKELLLKDLCARLPYQTRVKVWLKDGTTEEGALDLEHNYGDVLRDAFYYDKIAKIKPYLFPLSSMTEEQEKEYDDLNSYELGCFPHTEEALDYLIKNNFDYRGLIEEGLAIDATGLNIYWFMTTNDIEKVEIIPLYEIIKNQQENKWTYY